MVSNEVQVLRFPDRPVLRMLGECRWELTHHYLIPIDGRHFTVPCGFITDLASVPKRLRSLIDDSGLGGAAPIGHDFLYQSSGRCDHLPRLKRRQVDALFRGWMKMEKVPAFRRTVAWLAVRLAGWACWHRDKKGTTTMIFDWKAIRRLVAGFFSGTFAASYAALGPLVVAFKADFAAGEQAVVAAASAAIAALLALGGAAFKQWRAYARNLLA